MPARPHLPARAAVLLLLLVGLVLPVAATVHARLAGPHLHGVVVGMTGPVIVTQEAARRADALPGRPLDARPLAVDDSHDDSLDARLPAARRLVADGTVDAVVVVDLRRASDTLLVPAWVPDEAAAELARAAGAVSGSYGRDLRVDRVGPPRPAGPLPPPLLAAGLVAAGVVLAAGISAWRGPFAATRARGVARVVGTAAAGLVLGAAAALLDGSGTVPLAAAAAATVAVSAWLVLAAEAVLGLAGLGLATGLLLGPVAPLLGGADPAYLPSPWWQLDTLAPQQAALRLLTHGALGVDEAGTRSWLLLAAWAAIGLLTLVATREVRPADPA